MVNNRTYEIMRFGTVGFIAFAIHYTVYGLLNHVFTASVAYTIGYATSFLCNFLLSSHFTFRVKPTIWRFCRFGVSHLLNCILQLVLLNLWLFAGVSETWAPIPTVLVSFPISFLLTKYALRYVFTLKNNIDEE